MELVKMNKPLSALDFCYQVKQPWRPFSFKSGSFLQGDGENISILECISLCVLVVAYDSGTKRARQMLAILESILPFFLRDLVTPNVIKCFVINSLLAFRLGYFPGANEN
jgi:hypothetical protein